MRTGLIHFGKSEDKQMEPHFLEACSYCRKQLGSNKDIFMYRGNTPFCSKECRQEQIDIDEAKENNLKHSSRAMRKSSDPNENSTSNKTVRTGTVVVA